MDDERIGNWEPAMVELSGFLADELVRAGQVSLRSSLARSGLTHNMAGFVDPGFCGSVITLELVNVLRFRALRLRPGLKIAQVAFFRGQPVPKHASYAVRGKYNWDVAAQPSKGVR